MAAKTKKPPTTKRSRGRVSGKNLGVPLMIRAETQQQKARWQAAAERDRRNLSSWIRVTLDDAAGRTEGER